MLKNIRPNKSSQSSYKKTKSILTDEFIEHQSYTFVALLGYVILGLMFFDYMHLLIPPKLLNPNWELEVIGRIIESIWILLLGFTLVFFRTQNRSVKLGELKVLSFLSWLTLFIAIACFLAAPLSISNALRIDRNNKAQINAQIVNQNNQVERVFTQIEKASDREINAILQSNRFKNLEKSDSQGKEQLLGIIEQRQKEATKQFNKSLKNKQVKLFKTTAKWTIGAIISGISFIFMWKYTSWTRKLKI